MYRYDKLGFEIAQLTKGDFDVTKFYGYDESKKLYYYQAAAESPLRREVYFISEDGKNLLQGDLYNLDTKKNLTEGKRAGGRLKVIDAIDPATMIIFKPTKTRYVVDVFTDLDCAYCRKLHSEIDSYLAEGIEIRYLAYPRSGYRTRSYFKAVSAWCADDRKMALTKAKAGEDIESKTCNNPVDEHMAAADKLGITGTPTLIMPDGSIVPGYVPAKQLAKILTTL